MKCQVEHTFGPGSDARRSPPGSFHSSGGGTPRRGSPRTRCGVATGFWPVSIRGRPRRMSLRSAIKRSAFRPEAMWVLWRPAYCGGIDPMMHQRESRRVDPRAWWWSLSSSLRSPAPYPYLSSSFPQLMRPGARLSVNCGFRRVRRIRRSPSSAGRASGPRLRPIRARRAREAVIASRFSNGCGTRARRYGRR
jgi:hypothetical protein